MAAPCGGRKTFRGKFCILQNLSGLHPLHLQLDEQEYNSVFNYPETDHIVAAVRKQSVTSGVGEGASPSASLLVCVYKSKVQFPTSLAIEKDDKKDSGFCLGCTEIFLQHYNFPEAGEVVLHKVEAYPIKRIVIGAKSSGAYDWARSALCCPSLLVNICRGPILVRKQDVLLLPTYSVNSQGPNSRGMSTIALLFDLEVLECEPVCQGILSVNTEIIVHNISEMKSNVKPNKSYMTDSSILTTLDVPLLSDFAKPIEELSNLKTSHEGIASDKSSSTHSVFNISCIDSKAEWDHLCHRLVNESDIKDPNAIGVISKNAAKHNGLFHGSVVCLTLFTVDSVSYGLIEKISASGTVVASTADESGNNKCASDDIELPRRFVTLLVSESSSIEDKSLYVTPVFKHNLLFKRNNFPENLNNLQVSVKPLQGDDTQSSDRSYSYSCHARVPFAKELHISFVHSPSKSDADMLDSVMRSFFSSPRLLSIGDIIPLSSAGNAQCFQELTETVEQRFPVVYFKVIKYEPIVPGWDCFLADVQHTSVFQAGIVQSYLPLTTRYWERPQKFCPPLYLPKGLTKVTEQVKVQCSPYLNSVSYLSISSKKSLPTASFLLKGPIGCGKGLVVRSVAIVLSMQVYKVNCHDLSGETSAATEQRIRNVFTKAHSYCPCILFLTNIGALSKNRDGVSEDSRVTTAFLELMQTASANKSDWPLVVIATSNSSKQMSSEMYEGFLHHFKIEVPTEEERRDILDYLLATVPYSASLSLSHISQRTAGMVYGDLQALVAHAKRAAIKRIKKECVSFSTPTLQQEEDMCLAGVCVAQEDFELALDQLQAAHSDAIGAPQIPNVSWEDVGGLADIKAEILDTIQLPLEHPELFAAGLRRSGVLLYGPPGTGKTLLAKAVATECSLNFLSVKGPELINMYVGQSEENVREVFSRARSAAPCVVFFDELDSLAPNRGRSGDSGGVMDRVVSQLLAELDGLHKACDVFVIGATNRPDLLDPALLRPGRFDKLLYLGVSENRRSQVKILKALTRKFQLGPDVELDCVADQCPLTLTGADFYALCSDALLNAMKRKIEMLERGEEVDQTTLQVENQDFLTAMENLTPSVSEAELQHYKFLQFSLLAKRE